MSFFIVRRLHQPKEIIKTLVEGVPEGRGNGYGT